MNQDGQQKNRGFTIVELLIVVVVIAILAAITIVSYNGITKRATETTLQSELKSAATQLSFKQVDSGSYPLPPLPSDINAGDGGTFQYTSDGQSYCLTIFSTNTSISPYYISSNGSVAQGACPGHSSGGGAISDGSPMQTINATNCPTTRTRAVDARDSHTYWVQKLADGNCWMLTNLAYAGGGVNTYSDVRTVLNGTSDTATTFYDAKYYIVPGGNNYTVEPAAPSTATDGTGQYGYVYNWCAAIGAQLTTSACSNGSPIPDPDLSVTICPAGWRLPTAGGSGQFGQLNTAINGGLTNIDTGLRTVWLGQRAGYWSGNFGGQGTSSDYWSSTQLSSSNASSLYFANATVNTADSYNKFMGYAVRCTAQ